MFSIVSQYSKEQSITVAANRLVVDHEGKITPFAYCKRFAYDRSKKLRNVSCSTWKKLTARVPLI